MSRRTSEANKAIAAAWENEKQRVSEGKGTRDWSQEQQQDILDRGKAYDENGKAFEGQHMRSAEKHPDCQGDPDNIQFLTREEHLAAHGGDWRNPTNGYYDPVTRIMNDFGDGPIVPCKVIELSDPVVKIEIMDVPQSENEEKPIQPEEKKSTGADPPKTDSTRKPQPVSRPAAPVHAAEKTGGVGAFFKKVGRGIAKGAKVAGTFVVEHKDEIGAAAALIVGGIIKAASDSRSGSTGTGTSENSGSRSYPSSSNSYNYDSDSESFDSYGDTPSENRNYPDERQSPREHDVSGYTRYWNGKEIHVDPYKRGGRKTDDE